MNWSTHCNLICTHMPHWKEVRCLLGLLFPPELSKNPWDIGSAGGEVVSAASTPKWEEPHCLLLLLSASWGATENRPLPCDQQCCRTANPGSCISHSEEGAHSARLSQGTPTWILRAKLLVLCSFSPRTAIFLMPSSPGSFRFTLGRWPLSRL